MSNYLIMLMLFKYALIYICFAVMLPSLSPHDDGVADSLIQLLYTGGGAKANGHTLALIAQSLSAQSK